jgi:hypothetical protein
MMVYRETRNQTQQCVDHSRIRYLPHVVQVDIDNEQGNCKSNDTVAERFHSAFGHGAPLFKPPNRNLTQAHCMSWHGLRIKITHRYYAQCTNLAVSLTKVAKESASIFRIMCARWI